MRPKRYLYDSGWFAIGDLLGKKEKFLMPRDKLDC